MSGHSFPEMIIVDRILLLFLAIYPLAHGYRQQYLVDGTYQGTEAEVGIHRNKISLLDAFFNDRGEEACILCEDVICIGVDIAAVFEEDLLVNHPVEEMIGK
jgi:hypothetical protein